MQQQEKTFTRWVNRQLEGAGLSIADLRTDLRSGLVLIKLMEVLSGSSIKTRLGSCDSSIKTRLGSCDSSI